MPKAGTAVDEDEGEDEDEDEEAAVTVNDVVRVRTGGADEAAGSEAEGRRQADKVASMGVCDRDWTWEAPSAAAAPPSGLRGERIEAALSRPTTSFTVEGSLNPKTLRTAVITPSSTCSPGVPPSPASGWTTVGLSNRAAEGEDPTAE